MDIGLSDTGRAQVAGLAAAVRTHSPTKVIVSPLLRAVQSCEVLGFEPDFVDKRWQEADLGDWTGVESTTLKAAGDGLYDRWRWGEHTPPGGESFRELSARVADALAELATGDDTTLVVTHGGPIRAACAHLVGLVPRHVVSVSPGSLTVIDQVPGRPATLRAYNHTKPVPVEEPPD
jgi:broad specificity phosphatase PhoE